MKNFFEAVKEFCARHFKQVTFVIFAAIGTIIALLTNYAHNQGYGDSWNANSNRTHYHDYGNSRRERHDSERKPWKFQKPSSSSRSSGHK